MVTAEPIWAGGRVEVFPDRSSPGEVFSVRVTGVTAGGPMEASFAGRTFGLWRTADGDWEGLVAVGRDDATGRRELLVLDRSPTGDTLAGLAEVAVTPKDYLIQRLTVNERMVTLAPEDRERARRESKIIRQTLATRSRVRKWRAPFLLPLEGPVSSPFGVRRVYNGKRRGYHSGLDIAGSRGDPVTVPAAGRVALVGEFFYTGNTVLLDHGLGLMAAYFHLDSVAVDEGQELTVGTPLGAVGSTGRSTGPHLHWGVYLCGVKVDPMSLIRIVGGAAGGGETP
jgi:murein DD-endopeptidase MepM/ murein hydrolase activator NlpD